MVRKEPKTHLTSRVVIVPTMFLPLSYCSSRLTTPPALCHVASAMLRELIKCFWEIDPLLCLRCGTEMAKIAVVQDPLVISRILRHLNLWEKPLERGPPPGGTVYEPCYDDLPPVAEPSPPRISRSSQTTISMISAPFTIESPTAAHPSCGHTFSNRWTPAFAPESAQISRLPCRRAPRKCAHDFSGSCYGGRKRRTPVDAPMQFPISLKRRWFMGSKSIGSLAGGPTTGRGASVFEGDFAGTIIYN